MQATKKQKDFVASLIKQYATSFPALEQIWKSIPKNNKKYPDTRCDYKAMILSDMLDLESHEASILINYLLGKPDKYGRFNGLKGFQALQRNFKHLIKNTYEQNN